MVEGVQFHPESILTPDGPALMSNFLQIPPANARPRTAERDAIAA